MAQEPRESFLRFHLGQLLRWIALLAMRMAIRLQAQEIWFEKWKRKKIA